MRSLRRFGAPGGRALALRLVAVALAMPVGRGDSATWARRATTFAVGELTIHFVDRSRSVLLPGRRRQPRPIVTEVLYPLGGTASHPDVPKVSAALGRRRFPLVVFGHGFNVTPATYAILLRAWVRAGYVVAAPVFPLSNSGAPGGANEADLVNQPTDMSFVITQLLRASARATGVLSGLINAREVAVAGQSDGGSTALAVAYNRHFADHRLRAAIILSGARIPGLGGYDLSTGGPPVLAVQGTADTSNAPSSPLLRSAAPAEVSAQAVERRSPRGHRADCVPVVGRSPARISEPGLRHTTRPALRDCRNGEARAGDGWLSEPSGKSRREPSSGSYRDSLYARDSFGNLRARWSS